MRHLAGDGDGDGDGVQKMVSNPAFGPSSLPTGGIKGSLSLIEKVINNF